MTASDVTDEHIQPVMEGEEHGLHPTEATYMKVALILAVLTGIEVAISYIKGLGSAAAPLLIILALTKFVLVVGYFMHLKFDNPVLRRVFTTGFALAIVVYIAVFLILGVFSTTHGAHA
ncbi:MAG TPA: cytochrome C oxidase subunit IV family protein [Acidimicrobiales bacterium]